MEAQNLNKAAADRSNMAGGRSRNQPQQIDLFRLCMVLLRKLWLILLVGVLTAGAAWAGTQLLITPTYQASALMYVNNSVSIESTRISISGSDLSTSTSLVSRYAVIVTSRPTINSVIQETGVSYTYEQLADMISVSSVDDTEFFRITVTDTDPEEARMIANALADALPDRIESIMEGCSARVVENAVLPTRQSYPNPLQNAVDGAVIGMFLVCCILVLWDIYNDRIELEKDITEVTDLPILAAIPELISDKSDGYGDYGSYEKGRSAE